MTKLFSNLYHCLTYLLRSDRTLAPRRKPAALHRPNYALRNVIVISKNRVYFQEISEESMQVKTFPPQSHHPIHSPPQQLLLHTHFSLLFIFCFKHTKQKLTLAALPEL